MYRWLRSFRAKDFDFLTHKNKGREPHNKFSVEFKSRVIQNIKKRYRDFQPALAQKYLQRDGLCLSRSSIWRINREIKSSEKVSHTPLQVHPYDGEDIALESLFRLMAALIVGLGTMALKSVC